MRIIMKHARGLTMLASAALLLGLASSPAQARRNNDAPKKEVLYPNTTRVEPKLDLTSQKDQKRSEEHTSELQSLMRISYAVFCLKKKKQNIKTSQPKKKR